ncbi:hypothetical protein [Sporomusa aerivorans]|uniref:hypothetical protein n=1 Tax=Sporomusa aerivorans TaxID=204936 RepID=UPI00352A8F3F
MATEISETLAFKTQIHKAWDATEQRMALRVYPRRSIAYDYYGMNAAQSQYLRALSYAKQNQKIEIPLWHAGCRLSESAYTDFSHVSLDTVNLWQFRGCSGVMFWRNDKTGGDRYFVKALYADGSLKLTEILEQDYLKASTVVYPTSYGYLKQEDKYSAYSSNLTTMQLNVDLLDDYSLTSLPTALNEYNYEAWKKKTPFQDALPASYLGVDIFPLAPSWTGDLAANFTRNANLLDNETGLVKYDLKSVYASENKEIEYELFSRSEINNFQRFFTRCKGRLKSFYAPTWLSDMTLVETASSGQLYLLVEWPLYWKYYASLSRRKLIIVYLRSGSVKIFPVAGYSTDSTGEYGKVYLESALTAPLRKSDVVMISFLCRYRFDSDTLTTDYDTTGIANVSTSFAEVNA